MVESCRVFTYSPNNRYAYDYYKACDNFDDIRNKVIKYEQSCDDRSSSKYKQMVDEFKYWDAQVPALSNIAGAEEEKLQQKREEEKLISKQGNAYATSPYRVDGNLNYFA